jgi:nucleoid DNA-binding protein
MNANLMEYLQQSTGYSETTVRSVIESLRNFIQVSLRNGEEVRIEKLGVFGSKDLPERKGRNPRTGEEIDIDAKRKPTFRFSKSFDIQTDPAIKPQKPIETVVKAASGVPTIPPMPPDLAPAPPRPIVPNRIWYLSNNGAIEPVYESELINRKIAPETPLWSEATGWKRASEIPELGYLLQNVA